MISVASYMRLLGGGVRAHGGSFTVDLGGEHHTFIGGPYGAYYLLFEREMATAFPVITPLGPIAGGLIRTSDFFSAVQADRSLSDLDPVSAIMEAMNRALDIQGEKPIANTLVEYMTTPEEYGGVKCGPAGVYEYMAAAHPGGERVNDVYHKDPAAVIKVRIAELVARIGELEPVWPGASLGPELAVECDDELTAIAYRALAGDRNAEPAIHQAAQEVLAKLGSKANQAKLAGCFPQRTGMPLVDFLREAQQNVGQRLGVTLELADLARVLNRYQGIFSFDPHSGKVSPKGPRAF